jgi:hypothetical protein
MSQPRRILSNSLTVLAGVLTVAFVLLVALVVSGEYLRPLWQRFVWESDPYGARPAPEIFEQFRREQEAVAVGADQGPLRCALAPWDGEDEHADLRLSLTNTSADQVTIWYHTWPHAHVTFLVRDLDGKAVASFLWGTLSSQAVGIDDAGRPTTKLPTLTLKPSEIYTAGIYLTSLRHYLDVPPGDYTVEAAFVYHDLGGVPAPEQNFVAQSEAVKIVVGAADGDKKPSWRIPRQ